MVRTLYFLVSTAAIVLVILLTQVWQNAWWLLLLIAPIIFLGIYDMTQTRSTIPRIFPVVGRLRFLFEAVRPEMQQYFVESDINGIPVNREFRSLIYQRAKGARDTRPFGTLFDVYRPGYEWMNQSMSPCAIPAEEPRVIFGGKDCQQPYAASHLNISAMSFGALSQHAIQALNKGASLGGFAHNTGEGGISPYHLAPGGDLVWQIGTGYFGCRDHNGHFDLELFRDKAALPQVKMIEIKISQGAKPGHGGILPAAKLTAEIAGIRHVMMGHDVVSPPAHTVFTSPEGLLQFVAQLRNLSQGKPVGFKLCLGHRADFLGICKAILETGILPDFITIDGGEGGTGAAPVELTNSVGTPLRDALWCVHNALRGIGVRDQLKLIASGKHFSAFHILRSLALGADTINTARGMMFALGCIQSRQCNANTCPTGVATQDPRRYKHLHIENKARRVAHYHRSTIHALLELVATTGLDTPSQVEPRHLLHRINGPDIRSYAELYPGITEGCLIHPEAAPADWQRDWRKASPTSWH